VSASPTPTPDAELRAHVEAIERDGFTIVRDVLTADEADAFAEDLVRLERTLGIGFGPNSFEGFRTTRIYNLLVHGARYQQIPVLPRVLPIVEGVLDAGCLISSLSSIAIGPDEAPQPIHADDQLIPLPKPHVPIICNTMWALTDFSDANGATRLVPGSHRSDHHPEYGKLYESIPAEMERGSVLVWNGSLWHGGGANRTRQRRIGIAMNYCAGWIRQQENQQLGIPPSIARGFSPRLRELVGYGVYRGLIGHIDKRSPVALLGDSGDLETVWQTADRAGRRRRTETD
jgi:ectoine hydroxylase-related dioxygenase (phytanoyl-CoA dioxygenase family)